MKDFRAVLGQEGFGRVYKGWLKERSTSSYGDGELVIAIKRWNFDRRQGIEWESEVSFLGRLSHHPNLVRLLGIGRENNELFLVYESMQRGSLENHLFGKSSKVQPLSWDTRLKVMIGAARGLSFLHSLDTKIIYRDFKPSNILLDKTYNAKLSNFDLAKFGPSTDDETHVSTQVLGTPGYVAPESIATGHLYVKSEVYGFGIVMVEILTGKRITYIIKLCGQNQSLMEWLKSNLLSRMKMRRAMDPKLEGKYPSKLASQVAHLALRCIQTDPKVRPSMEEVVETLEQIEAANCGKLTHNDTKRRRTQSRAAQLHGRPDGG
ncbi:putative serine/threonine-protein kinase PIX13 [Senna tora]|uniref:Putative serine/threonine-protein kinase PIX13 n=1 Tax=Senna tora TaxID=362788 RepID=A0A834W2C7_9FABA|nr:putative serine/threonine-protein kinase PIX13 [Senna tora]